MNTWMKFQSGLYCSNGIVALLLYCLAQKSENSKRNMQYGESFRAVTIGEDCLGGRTRRPLSNRRHMVGWCLLSDRP